MRRAVLHQLLHHERLKQLDCHLLRQAALIDLELRPHHNNRTSGIVHTLSQKVLTETPLLSLQHIRNGLQRTVAGACHRTSPPAVINQGIHSLLQHPLLVADNDVRRSQLQKPCQTVIPVNNPAIQVIQIRGGKTSAVQLYHGTDIRRDHRNHGHDHPLRFVAGIAECLHNLQPFDDTGALLAAGIPKLLAQHLRILLQVNRPEKLQHRLRAHSHTERTIAPLLQLLPVFLFRKYLLILQAGFPFIQHNIGRKI